MNGGDSRDAWFDASDLVEFETDPAPLPRFDLPDEEHAPFDLVRVAQDEAQDTAPWLPSWTLVGFPCLAIEARHGATGGRQ